MMTDAAFRLTLSDRSRSIRYTKGTACQKSVQLGWTEAVGKTPKYR